MLPCLPEYPSLFQIPPVNYPIATFIPMWCPDVFSNHGIAKDVIASNGILSADGNIMLIFLVQDPLHSILPYKFQSYRCDQEACTLQIQARLCIICLEFPGFLPPPVRRLPSRSIYFRGFTKAADYVSRNSFRTCYGYIL